MINENNLYSERNCLRFNEFKKNWQQFYINQSKSYISSSTITYVTDDTYRKNSLNTPVKTVTRTKKPLITNPLKNDTSPLLTQPTIVQIPKKIERSITRDIPKKLLDAIDSDRSTAIEKCILFVSNLTSTFYSDNRWKNLSSTNLHEQFKKGNDNTFVYKKIIEALKYKSERHSEIIEVLVNKHGSETYIEGQKSKSYRIADPYFQLPLVKYEIKTKDLIQKRSSYFEQKLSLARKNEICQNLLLVYPLITLPTNDEIIAHAEILVKEKHRTKKGKLLTFLNKHSHKYYKDFNERSFVEDSLKRYDSLIANQYIVPTIGDKKSGGRVTDSFNLMPSWIRNLIKIDGESTAEVDYKALHPNIAMSIYGGTKENLTHVQVAEESGINLKNVKIEHLAFFNRKTTGMKRSPLFKHYNDSEPEMIKNILKDKMANSEGHKISSMKMFKKEVDIMTETITRLNNQDIYVCYIYDALLCKQSQAEKVKEIMDEVIIEFGVHTTASISLN